MAYYDALITAWNSTTQPPAGVTGTALTAGMTTAQKIAAVNGWTVPGPKVDVDPATVKGKLILMQAFFSLKAFAATSPNGNTTHDNALGAAMALIEMMTGQNAPVFRMSDPTTYAQVKGMADALLAYELGPPAASPSTGFTQSVHDALLALAATTVPWWQANGYPRAFDMGDVQAAGVS